MSSYFLAFFLTSFHSSIHHHPSFPPQSLPPLPHQQTLQQLGILKLDLAHNRPNLRHHQLISLLQFSEPIRDIVLKQLLRKLLELEGDELDSFVFDVFDEVETGVGVGVEVEYGGVLG